jgi:hypothetical protein
LRVWDGDHAIHEGRDELAPAAARAVTPGDGVGDPEQLGRGGQMVVLDPLGERSCLVEPTKS